MVGFNLVLVCQGHTDDLHHLGPHISILGEVHAEEEPAAASSNSPRNQPLAPETASALKGCAIGPYVTQPSDFEGLSTLGLSPFIAALAGAVTRRRAIFSLYNPMKSQTAPGPEHPPPEICKLLNIS